MALRNMLSSEEFYQFEFQRFRRMYPRLPVETLEHWARDRQRRREYKPKIKRDAKYQRNRRKQAVAMLGGACVRCGQGDKGVLHIDHVVPVRGERKGSSTDAALKANGEGFQLLCVPCHKDKTREDVRLMAMQLRDQMLSSINYPQITG